MRGPHASAGVYALFAIRAAGQSARFSEPIRALYAQVWRLASMFSTNRKFFLSKGVSHIMAQKSSQIVRNSFLGGFALAGAIGLLALLPTRAALADGSQ